MTSVGERLRCERIRRGIDLSELARDTRINQKHLEAIEAGDSSQVPGGFFYRSFIRQYARAVGLNPKEVEDELERARAADLPILAAALEAAQFPIKDLDPIVKSTNPRMGRTWGYVVMLVGVVSGCGAFYSWWHRIETRVPDVVQVQSAPTRASESSSAAMPLIRPASLASPTQSEPVEQVVMTSPDDKLILTVSAHEKTWLSITSDGKTVFSGLLGPSETKVLGGKSRAYVRVGNAAGLEITWNGKAIGPIGQRGQVRTVEFTPENFRILAPAGSL